jgi:uncharacterized protein (UPF0332 family)
VTDDVRNDVAAELQLAEDCLTAAEHLIGIQLPAQAAGRLYYAAFHAARALLFSIGVAPRSHEALRSLFALHFVKTGKMATAHSKALAELEGLRGAGDYDPNFALVVEDLQPELDRARQVVADAKRVLAGK